jgi:hypothetical protein
MLGLNFGENPKIGFGLFRKGYRMSVCQIGILFNIIAVAIILLVSSTLVTDKSTPHPAFRRAKLIESEYD